MAKKPTYEDLEQKVKELEKEALEHKRVGEELKIKHVELEEIFKAIPDAVIFADLNRNITKINPGFTRLYGYKPEEIYGKKTKILYAREEEFIKQGKARYNPDTKGKYHPYEIDYRNKNGDIFHSETVGTPVRNEKDEAIGLLAIVRDISDRKQAEEALRKSEAKYRRVSDNSPAVLYQFLMEPGGKVSFSYVSEVVVTTMGVTPEEVMKDPSKLLGMVHPDDQKMFQEGINRSAETLESFPLTFRFLKNGEVIWIEARGIPTPLADGGILWDGFLLDITERKQAQEALRESEALLSMAGRTARFGGWSAHPDGHEVVWSEQVALIHEKQPGYSPTVKEAIQYYTPEWRDKIAAVFQICAREGIPWDEEMEIITAGGHRLWVRSTGEAVRDNRGKIVRVEGSFRDITERKLAEEALRESEEKYRTILETIEDGYFEVDLGGNFTFFNYSMCKILGYPRDELMGMNNRQYTDENIAKKLYQTFNKVYTTGKPDKSFHWPVIRKDSTKRTVAASISLRRDTDGAPVGFRGIVRDITERKRLEARLQQAHKMELVGTLAGGIAHDYNNLLAVIMGNLSMAREETAPHSVIAELLHEAEEASLKARDLTQHFLTLSQGGHPVKGLGSIGNLLKEIPEQVQVHDGIEYTFSIQDDLWPVKYDPKQIEYTITNLLMNAVEAMPQGGCITIQAENQVIDNKDKKFPLVLNEGKYVRISIKDEGSGISEEHMDKIFDPYFSTKDKGTQKGMGMGLAIAQSVIQKHDGHIMIDSTTGAGTEVTIYLPAAEEKEEPETVKQEREDITPSTSSDQTTIKKILVMDDEEMLRNLAQMMLERLGYEVETVKDGDEAIETYKKQKDSVEPFDAVILDLTIKGGMGGKQTILELIKIDPGVKAIVCSGYFNDPVITNFEEYGFQGAMPKPYQKADLEIVLKMVLR